MNQIQTEAVKQCHRCAAHLPAFDNFCRSCGVSQSTHEDTTAGMRGSGREMDAGRNGEAGQLLSSLLVTSLTRSVSLKTAPLRTSRLGIRVVAALAVLPIWLLIILLSPLDAYTAAKAASSQLNYQ